MFEQLKEFGTAYIVMMIMVLVVVIIDYISIIGVFTKRKNQLSEYAEFIVKYTKIIITAFMGAYFILQTGDDAILPSVKALHIILGVLALIDAAASLAVKLKYKYKG